MIETDSCSIRGHDTVSEASTFLHGCVTMGGYVPMVWTSLGGRKGLPIAATIVYLDTAHFCHFPSQKWLDEWLADREGAEVVWRSPEPSDD